MTDTHEIRESGPIDLTDQDVLRAMKAIHGTIDLSPGDFRKVYRIAFSLARERLMRSVTAREIMTRHVHLVRMDMNLAEMAELLASKGISGAPVIDREGRVVGVISEKDLLKKMGVGPGGSFLQVIAYCLRNKGCAATPMSHQTVRDVMSSPAVTAPPDISVAEISALMVGKNINRLPIVDIENRPVGIVTREDLINSYFLFQKMGPA